MQNDRFDAIPIPKELNHVVKAGIQEGIRQKKRLHRNKILLRHSAIAAALLAILCLGVLMVSDPALAAKLPVIGRIFSMVQEKVSYKGDFHDGAQIYNNDNAYQNQDKNTTPSSEPPSDKPSETPPDNALVQTSNGLTITVSEANCSSQALYLALCIENEEPFPADFIKTKNMEGYLPDCDLLYLKTNTYYDVPGLTKKERANGEAYGYDTPYYIEGIFVDDHTFTGIIRVSLDQDLKSSSLSQEGKTQQLPSQFTYYLEISDIYADLLQYEDFQARDPETNEVITLQDAVQKHYTGTWNFAIDITMNKEKTQVVQVNKTNDQGIGIASVEKTAFEIKADIILPSGAQPYDYVVAICDADGKPLQSQGENAEIYSVYGRNTDTVHVYVCDYIKYMDELKGDGQKIANGALFDTEIHFNK